MKTRVARICLILGLSLCLFAFVKACGGFRIGVDECQLDLVVCLADVQAQWSTGKRSEKNQKVYIGDLRICLRHYQECKGKPAEDEARGSDKFTSCDDSQCGISLP